MRRMFARRDHEMPELNTSSLPDLIFTVLFFFMIVTHMRDVEEKVSYQLPQGTEIRKMGNKASVIHIYIGHPADGSDGYRIQLNNRMVTLDDIRRFIAEERELLPAEEQPRMTVSIKADRDVPMGIIADVKQQLQQAFALRVSYAAEKAP